MKRTNQIALAAVIALLLGSSPSVWAKTLSVTNAQAQGRSKATSVKVWPGYGLNISFIETGESIIKAWLDDPSRIAMDLDGKDGAASVVHLRRIKPDLGLPLMVSQDGATLLTVITESEKGRKLYQIKVLPVDGVPNYFAVNVAAAPGAKPRIVAQLPPTPKPVSKMAPEPAPKLAIASAPVPLEQPQKMSFQPVEVIAPVEKAPISEPVGKKAISLKRLRQPIPRRPVAKRVVIKKTPSTVGIRGQSLNDANAAMRGLVVANRKGEIKRGSSVWYRVQSAVAWMRRGKSKETAATLSGVKVVLIEQVIAWGQRSGQIEG
jgi:hypothetical protein